MLLSGTTVIITNHSTSIFSNIENTVSPKAVVAFSGRDIRHVLHVSESVRSIRMSDRYLESRRPGGATV